MDTRIVLASRNAGKAREFERLFHGRFQVHALPAEVVLPEETGETFRDNALLKAEAAFAALGCRTAVLADDSGLEVRALGGRPGVQSARYAGEHATDHDNVSKLLRELRGVEDRRASFVCWLCLLLPEEGAAAPVRVEARGEAEGAIEQTARGGDGFGYDPVFRPTGWRQTLAEATPQAKDSLSHRGAAARVLLATLEERGLIGGH